MLRSTASFIFRGQVPPIVSFLHCYLSLGKSEFYIFHPTPIPPYIQVRRCSSSHSLFSLSSLWRCSPMLLLWGRGVVSPYFSAHFTRSTLLTSEVVTFEAAQAEREAHVAALKALKPGEPLPPLPTSNPRRKISTRQLGKFAFIGRPHPRPGPVTVASGSGSAPIHTVPLGTKLLKGLQLNDNPENDETKTTRKLVPPVAVPITDSNTVSTVPIPQSETVLRRASN